MLKIRRDPSSRVKLVVIIVISVALIIVSVVSITGVTVIVIVMVRPSRSDGHGLPAAAADRAWPLLSAAGAQRRRPATALSLRSGAPAARPRLPPEGPPQVPRQRLAVGRAAELRPGPAVEPQQGAQLLVATQGVEPQSKATG